MFMIRGKTTASSFYLPYAILNPSNFIEKLEKLVSQIFISIQSLFTTITSHPRKWEAYQLFETAYNLAIKPEKFKKFITQLETLSNAIDNEKSELEKKLKNPFPYTCTETHHENLKKWHRILKTYYEQTEPSQLNDNLNKTILFSRAIKSLIVFFKITGKSLILKVYFSTEKKLNMMIENTNSLFVKTFLKTARFTLNIGADLFFLELAYLLSLIISFEMQQNLFKLVHEFLKEIIEFSEDPTKYTSNPQDATPATTLTNGSVTLFLPTSLRLSQISTDITPAVVSLTKRHQENVPTINLTNRPSLKSSNSDSLFTRENQLAAKLELHPDKYPESTPDRDLAQDLFRYYTNILTAHKEQEADKTEKGKVEK